MDEVINGQNLMAKGGPTGRTLIIHGHADQDRKEICSFVERILGLPAPIVMAETMSPGMTLPQKFESLAREVDFAIALVTPDDEGRALTGKQYQFRARQNVLIEIGWFWGRLGLDHLLLLVKQGVEIPSDLRGLEFYNYSRSPLQCSDKVRSFFRAHRVATK